MALDRQIIEKRDFPIGRRGYDPDAVDAHLAMLSDELEALRRSSGRSTGTTLAGAASEQVRLIVDAAEQSATEIEREADLEARRIRQEAREAAEKQRNEAGTQAREHVQRVSESAATMLERIDAMDTELRGLLESLRGGANRVSADLALLQGSVGDLRGAPAPIFDPEADRPEPVRAADPEPEPAPVRTTAGAKAKPKATAKGKGRSAAAAPAPRRRGKASAAAASRPADEEGARLIALNMALNGTPREETERYLADNFDLADAPALLDDVYAQAGL